MNAVIVAVTLVLATARHARSLAYLCELDGDAEFSPGLSASTIPTAPPLQFAFQGLLSNCLGDDVAGAELCAVGTLNEPSCLGNQTEGTQFVICPNGCTSSPGGVAACNDGDTPLVESHFSGACIGAVCTGNNVDDRAFYVVAFDAATIGAASTACNPVTPGDPLTTAHFSGLEGRHSPPP